MEQKKNEKVDVHRKRGLFLTVGLIASLTMTLMAFEWKKEAAGELMSLGVVQDSFDSLIDVPPTVHTPPPPPVVQPTLITIVEDDELVEDIDFKIDVDFNEDDIIADIPMEELDEEVVEDSPFIVLEKEASFPGGQFAWGKFLRKHLRYPKQAKRMNIQGRVILSFYVSPEGELSDIKVLRSVGGGCDEEAIRVLKKSPRWSPGEQRGRAVRSPMVISIAFTLR